MPNHVMNEVKIKGTRQEQVNMLKHITNDNGYIDFNILLPMPLNCWQGNIGTTERKITPYNWFDWCSTNWSTKWNAYGQDNEWCHKITLTDNELVLKFQTAWNSPIGWLVALLNIIEKDIELNSCDEGNDKVINYKLHYHGSIEVNENKEKEERVRMLSYIYKD